MAGSIFLLPMIIVIAVCFSCTQQLPSPPVIKALTCNLQIQVLNQYYSPLNVSYSPPTDPNNLQQNYQLRQQILDDLSSAISNAPPRVQNDLCALSGVFIDSSSCLNGDVNNCQNVTHAFPVFLGIPKLEEYRPW